MVPYNRNHLQGPTAPSNIGPERSTTGKLQRKKRPHYSKREGN
jgi:hypothetical protein